ncbi:hypothetical protein CR513_18648, partial [Mucuna pruriens]
MFGDHHKNLRLIWRRNLSFDNSSLVTNNSDSFENSSTKNFAEPKEMENNDRTLKKLATPHYPQLEPAQSYKLKYGLIHLLSKFHGLVGEHPHKHLKEFHAVCDDEPVLRAYQITKANYSIANASSISSSPVQVPHSSSQSISAFGSLMTIAKHSSIAIPRNYAIATSSVGRD